MEYSTCINLVYMCVISSIVLFVWFFHAAEQAEQEEIMTGSRTATPYVVHAIVLLLFGLIIFPLVISYLQPYCSTLI